MRKSPIQFLGVLGFVLLFLAGCGKPPVSGPKISPEESHFQTTYKGVFYEQDRLEKAKEREKRDYLLSKAGKAPSYNQKLMDAVDM